MSSTSEKTLAREKRKARIRKRIRGTPDRPRLSVFRSASHVYAQVIDDKIGTTLVTASSVEPAFKDQSKFKSKVAAAAFVGKLVGQRAMEKGIKQVVFDRNGFLYHGRIKAISDGAREAGLDF
ncbi:MAG: 50S ribosomal protein L18 [Desulfobacteraceae bacterium]|nr:MAG: 50S ribosomal protein L18 [Desulfobacteraceae bacterium]